MYTEIDSRYGKWFNPLISYIIQYTPLVIQIEIFISSDSTYIRDSGIRILANELSEIFNQRIWLFRSEFQCTDTQIKYKFYQTETFIVLQTLLFTFFNLCLHFSILVHTFLLFRSHRGAAEIIQVLRILASSLNPWYTDTDYI